MSIRVVHPHRWDLYPKEAIQLQQELRSQVQETALDWRALRWVAGVDVGFPQAKQTAQAAIVVLDLETLECIDQTTAELPVSFPYVPGLLSFREMPVILAAIEKLSTPPDLWMVDGHGKAHPRRFGLACHLGLLLDQPAFGCGKSILVGKPSALPERRGSTAHLIADEQIVGAAVRTRNRVKPVYISTGHRIDLDTAIQVTLACGTGYRLPEPIRQADRLASMRS